jgi:hypothetical protein
VLDNTILFAALICFALGLVLSGLARIGSGSTLSSVTLPVVFLASYVLTYQQVPPFPPLGATNKIFYIALATTLIGFALDLQRPGEDYVKLFIVVLPLAIVGWIASSRFTEPDVDVSVLPSAWGVTAKSTPNEIRAAPWPVGGNLSLEAMSYFRSIGSYESILGPHEEHTRRISMWTSSLLIQRAIFL